MTKRSIEVLRFTEAVMSELPIDDLSDDMQGQVRRDVVRAVDNCTSPIRSCKGCVDCGFIVAAIDVEPSFRVCDTLEGILRDEIVVYREPELTEAYRTTTHTGEGAFY